MPAKFENKLRGNCSRIWIEKYKILHNLPHWHVASEMVVCQSGSASVVIDGHFLSIHAGEIAVFHGGSIHFINTEADGLLYVLQIDSELIESIVGQRRLVRSVFDDRFSAVSRLEDIYAELKSGKPFYLNRADAMISELIIDIFREEQSSFNEITGKANPAVRYKNLLEKIYEDYEFFTFQDAASFMCMSEAYFSKFFKKLSGMTFSDYLNLVKTDKAVEMLHQDPGISATELMLKCGFNTLRHFYRVFKKFTGYAPGQLPRDFSINLRSQNNNSSSFDPTLPSTVRFG